MIHLYKAADMIEAEGLAEIGLNLFVGTMPHDSVEAVMLRDPLTGASVNEEQGTFVQHQFQVIVRGTDPKAEWDKAYAIGQLLKVQDVETSEIKIRKMYPLTLPATYPADDSDNMETSIRIRIWFALL